MKSLREIVRKSSTIRKFFGYYLASSGLFDSYFKNYKLDENWQERLKNTLACKDSSYISKVPNAGKIKGGKQTMHNGLLINLGSYYGPEYSVVLQESGGIHEPQEERVFNEIIKIMPTGATMLEMGAFWSFYSMWFNSKVDKPVNIMVEPDSFNLGQGKRNFKLNDMNGTFIKANIGKKSQSGRNQTFCVDDIISQNGIKYLDLLHSDIQGFEYDMLLGAKESFMNNKIGYVFISTHSNLLHYKCIDFLKDEGFVFIAQADLDQTYSEDGLIVACSPKHQDIIEPIKIDLRN